MSKNSQVSVQAIGTVTNIHNLWKMVHMLLTSESLDGLDDCDLDEWNLH